MYDKGHVHVLFAHNIYYYRCLYRSDEIVSEVLIVQGDHERGLED